MADPPFRRCPQISRCFKLLQARKLARVWALRWSRPCLAPGPEAASGFGGLVSQGSVEHVEMGFRYPARGVGRRGCRHCRLCPRRTGERAEIEADQGRGHLHRAGRAAVGQPHPQGAQRRPGPRRHHLCLFRERRQHRLRARHARICRAGQRPDLRRGLRRRAGGAQGRGGLSRGRLRHGLLVQARRTRTSRSSTTSSTSRATSPA